MCKIVGVLNELKMKIRENEMMSVDEILLYKKKKRKQKHFQIESNRIIFCYSGSTDERTNKETNRLVAENNINENKKTRDNKKYIEAN